MNQTTRLFSEYLHQITMQGTPDDVEVVPGHPLEFKDEHMHSGE